MKDFEMIVQECSVNLMLVKPKHAMKYSTL